MLSFKIKPFLNTENALMAGFCLFALGLTFSVSFTEAGLALAFAAGLYRLAKNEKEMQPQQSAFAAFCLPPWLLYLAVGLMASAFALDVRRALNYFPSDLIKAWACLFLIVALPASKLEKPLSFYKAGAIAVSLWAVVKCIFNSAQDHTLARANATMNAITFGEVTALAFTLFFILSITKKEERRYHKFGVAATGTALLLSQSRGAILGAALALLILAILEKRARKAAASVFIAATIAAGMACALNTTARTKILSVPKAVYRKTMSALTGKENKLQAIDYGAQTRLNQWKAAAAIMRDYPVFGVGPSNIKTIFHFYHPAPIDGEYGWSNVHSLYLQQGAERGFIGLGVLLYLLTVLLAITVKAFKTSKNEYTLWAVCSFSGFLVMNITETSFQHAVVSMSVFFTIACAIASLRRN
ncbi:MAG: O-antigen ligase family protein [Elusimicrobiaceae bacterium]|jgi:O-antigen ligase